MIVFASSITKPDVYERCAAPGLRLAAEPDTEVRPYPSAGSIFRSYNLILDDLAGTPDMEALVLLHQDSEITDPDFCKKLRRAMEDPDVGVVGAVGAVGVRNIAWWEGSATWGSFAHRYEELGGGEIPAMSWEEQFQPSHAHTGEVDTVDGFVLCLSPWVVENIRFDESLGQKLHGYDFDFCLQVREAGKKVVTEDLKVAHHHELDLVSDPHTWIEAHMKVADKWEGRMPMVGSAPGDWKERARRAEAEAALARTQSVATELRSEARVNLLERSISWRITEPLRRFNAVRKARGNAE